MVDHEQAVSRQPCEAVTTAATSPTFCFDTAYIHRAASNDTSAFLFPASDNISMARPGALLSVVFLMPSSTQQTRQYWLRSVRTLRTYHYHSRKFISRLGHRFEAEANLHSEDLAETACLGSPTSALRHKSPMICNGENRYLRLRQGHV